MTDSNRPAATPTDVLARGAAALARGDLDATLTELLRSATASVGADLGTVWLQDPDRVALELGGSVGVGEEALAALAEAVNGEAAAEHPIVRAVRDGVALTAAETRPDGTMGRTLALPMTVTRGGIDQRIGALALDWRGSHPVSEADASLLEAVANLLAVAVDQARLTATAAERAEWFERMAHSDPLTGLANARTFARVLELEIARASRQGSEVSVAVFDVDDFASINDAAGNEVGDDILRRVAAVISESTRLVDTVARYGADDFVLVAPGSAGVTVAKRVLDGIAALPSVDGRAISVSAGVARFPVDGSSSESLLAAAEAAVTQGRTSGRGGIGEAATSSAG